MEVMFERVAGIDIGKATLTVCVRTPGDRRGRRRSETRTFKTTTGSLLVMRDWLVECGVAITALESTSTYWKGCFYCLEDHMEVWLLNAAHMHAVPGRKSDVKDSEWIAQLLEHGLLSPSFVPPPEIRRLRMLTRHRTQLMGDRTRDTARLELMLEDATIKLSCVASSVNTVSARLMIGALICGETDPLKIADLAKGKMRVKIPDLTQAVTGNFTEHHATMARAILRRLDLVEQAIKESDELIAAACARWQHQIDLLQTIPGVGEKVAQVIVAQTGADMSRFPSAGHLAAWAGVAPTVNESAGRRWDAGTRHGDKWLSSMLVEAAGSVSRMKGKNYLSEQHARITARRGAMRAHVAVAHSILVSAYYMLQRDEPYRDLGADWYARRDNEAHPRRLVHQLEKLGHTVRLDPAACAHPADGTPPGGDHACPVVTYSRVCMARGSRVPLDCCRRARGSVSWQRALRATRGVVVAREGSWSHGSDVRAGRWDRRRQGDADRVRADARPTGSSNQSDADVQDDVRVAC